LTASRAAIPRAGGSARRLGELSPIGQFWLAQGAALALELDAPANAT